MAKKRELSALGRVELQLAHDSLLNLKRSIVYEESEEDKDLVKPAEGSCGQPFGALPSESRPHSLIFSGMTVQNLTKLKIEFTGRLFLKPDFTERIAATTTLGQNEFYFSENLYRQLLLLEGLIPRPTEASGRAWIEAFLFRASAMLPPDKRMVLNISTLSRFVDYTAVVASQRAAGILLQDADLDILGMHAQTCFFVMETKFSNSSDDVPQAVCRMYECGKLLQKSVVRGALTNGRDWIFLLVNISDDYDSASYRKSDAVELQTTRSPDGQLRIDKPWPDFIAAILLYWIENGFAELGSNDWFEA
ncbi:hypothetical protein BD410DRAFT_841469 [Rickenella mellea]|uniref:Fungal-type protein kinase domain-containing protein n=1 Tax=Rickenella mellea TaxID=50990 RepID=A0A4Y7PZQ2_9AGAM|nr:hypothetical protein BD410DRAFT_841469 [Rickenella mellea]